MNVLQKTDLSVEVAGEELVLMPERAAYWPRRSTLLIADVHIGKDAAFRAEGIPLAAGGTSHMLSRLGSAIERTGCSRLVVLGDFFHSESGRDSHTLNELATWCSEWAGLEIVVIAGNHDRRTRTRSGELGISLIRDVVTDGPFVLRHYPGESPDGYVLAGHLHPVAHLRQGRVDSLKLPCFVFGDRSGVLPAFSRFTGRNVYRPVPSETVFVIAEDQVLQVS